jgi:hypothetical protein
VDASGNGNNGKLFNTASSAWTVGTIGNALAFDGVDDFVQISNRLGASFTIACWIKTTQNFQQVIPTYNGTGIIWSDVGGAANDFVFGGTRGTNGVNRLSFYCGSGDLTVNGTQEISTGQWTHLAVTRDGVSGMIKLYLNGSLDTNATTGTAVLNANPIINIGGNTLDGRYFNGSLDDVRFYSRVLTAAEIATFLPNTLPTVSLATPSATTTNNFPVTAIFSEVVSGFAPDDLVIVNGHASQFAGSGGAYSFQVAADLSGPVTVRVPANCAVGAKGNGNLASDDLVVTVSDETIPALGLVGYWSFNETNGLTAFDSSSATNHGALQNLNNTNRVTGVWGNGLFFNGTNGYVRASNNLGADFTISLWIKTTQNFQQTDNTYDGTGLFWSDVSGAANDFILGGTRSPGGTNRLSFFTGNPNNSLNGTKNISNGQWTHLAVTRRQSTGERRLFVNGVLDVAGNGGTALLTANPVVSIGGNTLGNRYFLGQMDEVREYAFDTNPLQTNASPFNITRTVDDSLRVDYPRRTGFSGLIYTVMKSDDLINWSPVAFGVFDETTTPISGRPMEMVTDKIISPTQGAFFRLKVNQ